MKSYRIAVIAGDGIGKEVIPAGTQMAQRDIKLESMGYLVDGVKGSVH